MNDSNNKWQFTEDYQGTEVAEYFATLEKVFSCEGEYITNDPISDVIRVTINNKRYYVKRYTAAGKSVRRYLGKSRIRSEWENLLAFKKLGMPVPNIVAYGQEIAKGLFKCGALITEEMIDTSDLEHYISHNVRVLDNKKWVYSVINQVADYTRIIHQAGYVHGNLNWRNILVTTRGEAKVFFIDCPSGGYRKGRSLRRAILKDIAFLDKLGRQFLSRTDQLRFYKRYKQIDKLTEHDKRDITIITTSLNKHRERKYQRFLKVQQEMLKGER